MLSIETLESKGSTTTKTSTKTGFGRDGKKRRQKQQLQQQQLQQQTQPERPSPHPPHIHHQPNLNNSLSDESQESLQFGQIAPASNLEGSIGSLNSLGSVSNDSFTPLSLDFDSNVAPVISAPLSMAPISGFRHKQQAAVPIPSRQNSKEATNNNSSTNTSTSPRLDGSLDNSLDNSSSASDNYNGSSAQLQHLMKPLTMNRTYSGDLQSINKNGDNNNNMQLPHTSQTMRNHRVSTSSTNRLPKQRQSKPHTHHASSRPRVNSTPDLEAFGGVRDLDDGDELSSSPVLSPLLKTPHVSQQKTTSIPPLTPGLNTGASVGEMRNPPEPENKGVVLTGHRGPVNHIAKLSVNSDIVDTHNGSNLIVTGAVNELRVWNVKKGVCVCSCIDDSGGASRGETVTSLTTCNNAESGNNIISGTESGFIKIYDLGRTESGDARLSSRFLAHNGKVTCMVTESHENGNVIGSYPRIVSGGSDRVVALWDPRLRQPQVFKFKGHTDTVNCLLLDSSRACVISGGRDQTIRIWDVRTGRQRTSQNEHFGSINCLTMCKQKSVEGGGSYLSSGRDGVVCVWKRGSGELSRSLRQGPNAKGIMCLATKNGEGSDGGSRR